MTVVAWKEVRIRVRIEAPSSDSLRAAEADILKSCELAAKRRVLQKRYNLEAPVEVWGRAITPLSVRDFEKAYG